MFEQYSYTHITTINLVKQFCVLYDGLVSVKVWVGYFDT